MGVFKEMGTSVHYQFELYNRRSHRKDKRMKESFDSMPTFSYQGRAPPSVALPNNRLAMPEGHQMGSPIVSGLILIAEDNKTCDVMFFFF